MKNKTSKNATPESKEEAQAFISYKEDLKEIKEILKELLGKLKGITGG